MTSLQMIEIIGKSIDEIMTHAPGTKDYKAALEKAEFVAKLAKQHSNEVDLIIRGDKGCGRTDRTNYVLGDICDGK